MKSAAEIQFRLRQEAANLVLLLAQPTVSVAPAPAPLPGLPDPRPLAASLRGSAFAEEIARLAQSIVAHRIPLFDIEVETGPEIDWTRDYVHGISSPASRYFRRTPYLDFSRVGDHKMVWELSRHQHLVVLAQAFAFDPDPVYIREIESQLESWWGQNRFQCGMNWASALEVAFRVLSWIWIWHLTGDRLSEAVRRRMMTSLYQHGLHLEYNLSVYFAPNTHLLGEAIALHALGLLFPDLPGAFRWRALGRRVVLEQMAFQIRDDGSHFEQSTYYHVYAVDFFTLHHFLEPAPPAYEARLGRMVEYRDAFLGPEGQLACIGDDDGGRLFHPYGPRAAFGRGIEQVAWWLGLKPAVGGITPQSRWFPDSGLAVMNAGSEIRVLVDAGPFGHAGAGHSHADTLSIIAWRGGEEILIDPASYTYIASPEWRNRFRGTAFHNTISVNGEDQAVTQGPFRWRDKPTVERHAWSSTAELDFLDASCTTASGWKHRRRVVLLKAQQLLFVLDDVTGGSVAEQFWHPGDASQVVRFGFALPAEPIDGWRSLVLGSKMEAPVLRVRQQSDDPMTFATVIDLRAIDLRADPAPAQVVFEAPDVIRWSDGTVNVTQRIP